MKELIDQIEKLTASFRKDAASQLDNGNKGAGLRARGSVSLSVSEASSLKPVDLR